MATTWTNEDKYDGQTVDTYNDSTITYSDSTETYNGNQITVWTNETIST